MNFLAHIYLSGDNEELLIGNFIADFVKGSKKDLYPVGITRGIELHRAIDNFTDHHQITAESKSRLYPRHHKYAPVIVDIYYDHFLAKNFSLYYDIALVDYVAQCYEVIQKHYDMLPEGVKQFFPYMVEKNWLLNYSTVEGIGRTLKGLSSRVAFPNKMNEATIDLENEYSLFEDEFSRFFPQLINFVHQKR